MENLGKSVEREYRIIDKNAELLREKYSDGQERSILHVNKEGIGGFPDLKKSKKVVLSTNVNNGSTRISTSNEDMAHTFSDLDKFMKDARKCPYTKEKYLLNDKKYNIFKLIDQKEKQETKGYPAIVEMIRNWKERPEVMIEKMQPGTILAQYYPDDQDKRTWLSFFKLEGFRMFSDFNGKTAYVKTAPFDLSKKGGVHCFIDLNTSASSMHEDGNCTIYENTGRGKSRLVELTPEELKTIKSLLPEKIDPSLAMTTYRSARDEEEIGENYIYSKAFFDLEKMGFDEKEIYRTDDLWDIELSLDKNKPIDIGISTKDNQVKNLIRVQLIADRLYIFEKPDEPENEVLRNFKLKQFELSDLENLLREDNLYIFYRIGEKSNLPLLAITDVNTRGKRIVLSVDRDMQVQQSL